MFPFGFYAPCTCRGRYQNDPHHLGCPHFEQRPASDVARPVIMGKCDCGSAKGGGGHYDWCGSLKPAAYPKMNAYEAARFIDDWGGKPEEYFVVTSRPATSDISKSPCGPATARVANHRLTRADGAQPERFCPGDLVRWDP